MDASYANDCVEHQCGAKLTPERMMEASISSPRHMKNSLRPFELRKSRIYEEIGR